MSTDHCRIDPLTGSVSVTLEHLYETLIDWHIDEATDREEAAVYARRFVLRLLDVDVLGEARALTGIAMPGVGEDLERDAFDRRLDTMLAGTVRRIREIEGGDD